MFKLKKVCAIAIASGVMLTGSMIPVAPVAFAQTAGGVVQPAGTFPSLPTNANRELVIHKFSSDGAAPADHNGRELADESALGTPLAGAVFTIYKVKDVDLLTNAGWKKAEDIVKQPVLDEASGKLDNAGTITTDGNGTGKASFAPGLYLVKETTAPEGHGISTKPFYVTLPLTDPVDRNNWLDKVHVYPKNTKLSEKPTKSVTDAGAFIYGNYVKYTIGQQLHRGGTHERYEMTDFYPNARLELFEGAGKDPATGEAATLARKLYGVVNGQETVVFTPNTDYTVVKNEANGPDFGIFRIQLTATGLEKLKTLSDQDGEIKFDIFFKVKENAPAEVTAITNKYDVFERLDGVTPPPGYPDEPADVPPTTEPDNGWTKSYFGNVDIVKKGKEGDAADATRLAGAEFDLYVCEAGQDRAQFETAAKKLNTAPIVADATDAPDIKGLRANDFVNGSVDTTSTQEYCLVETKAPAGFSLLAEPIHFKVTKGANIDTIALTSLEIVDYKQNAGFNLPLTGGKGVMFLLLSGAAFLAAALGVSRRNKRREA
ncbi:SpaH/EbpB family LPXTG-anchored major pilin [Corynebacterium sp. HS2168-gen11]|uniref:SpaH/EbpB family LPXTG-anchored major pilin n=1 Tax=Corynebacterium sp. HS2168-gen11 TaxID=2974027 RepID=UPI00216B1AE7|nr:SpaH/EbpB family LPXTG-anchored major pilin [Corynebacterium sp. HS2168-gen11]MCS4536426.1 SpaH/EbpB family LPXTG-anchored major pilin [Corynebacterium sp. HS2168-gen11]